MTDFIVEAITGADVGKYLATFIISMIPVIELRGAIPIGVGQMCIRDRPRPRSCRTFQDIFSFFILLILVVLGQVLGGALEHVVLDIKVYGLSLIHIF